MSPVQSAMTPGVPRVVFLDVEDDLHQIRADVGDLREDAAGDPERRRAERLADGEADEAGPGVVAWNEQEDAEHDQQLDADEQHADAHAGTERNRVDRERASLEPGERRARVGEGVHADAEPGDAVAAGDANQAEEEDDCDLEWRKTVHEGAGHRVNVRGKPAEVDGADDADEDPQDQDELSLGDEVGFAGLVNQLRDLAHRAVHRKIAQLHEDHHPERQTEYADPQACHEQRPAVDPVEAHLAKIGQHQVGFSARRVCGRRRRRAGGCAKAEAATSDSISTATEILNAPTQHERKLSNIALLKTQIGRSGC